MACAITTQWGNHVYWTPPNRDDISHYNVYRRTDEVAPVGTADVIAHAPFTLGQLASPHYWDPFTAVNSAPAYTYWITSVAWDGQCSALSNKITATTGPSLLQTSITTIFDDTNEPNGFVNRTDSVMSFDTTTMTFSISPAVTSFNYYVDGVRYTAVSAKTQVIPETSGLSIFYFTSAGLTYTSSVSDDDFEIIVEQKAICSVIYYNTADRTQIYFGEERHGIQMDGKTHHYLHDINGLMYESGFAINTITADATGNLDEHAQFGVDAGTVYDEDLETSAAVSLAANGLTIFWRSGTNGYWRTKTNAGFSVYTTAVGTRITYNAITSGEWSLIEVTNNQFALTHIFATTKTTNQVIAIMGQSDYSTLAAARAGATTEVNNLLLGSLPGPEMRPLATIIFQTSNGYGNAVKARVRSTDTGAAWYDWRTSGIQRGSGGGDHGSLSGLSDDDHAQYLLLAGRTSTQTICGAVTFNGVSSDLTIGNNNIKIGTACSTITLEGRGISLTSSGDVTIVASSRITLSSINVTAAASIQTTLHVSGAVTFGSTFNVSGITTLSALNTGNICANGTILSSGGLTVGGNIILSGTLTVTGATSVSGTLFVLGASTFNGITVSGIATIQTLNVTANASVQGTLHVSGSVTLGGSLNISGATSISNTLWICGSTTLNGLTVSGAATIQTLNVTANASVQGTLHVSGASTFGSTVTISGATTINNYIDIPEIAAPVNPAVDTGRLYVKDNGGGTTGLYFKDSAGTETDLLAGGGAGNAIYIEGDGAPAIDTNAADGYLVFDGNVFSATTVGQCATITIATDGIDDTHIDWGYAAGQVAADDIPIGSASDSDWTDGIMSWTDATTVAVALDDINETLSYLAPADASDLSGNLSGYVSFGGAAQTKYSGRLSDGNINYSGAAPAGSTVSYIIKSAPFTMTTPSGNIFNKADEGDTCYYHAVGGAAYAAAERRVSHTAVFSEADRAGSQSASTVAGFTTAELSVNYVAWYNSFPKWQVGSAYVTITSGLISRGYNRYKITRECGFVTQSSNDFEIFYDSAASTPVVGTTVVTENVPVLKKLSGVRMYDRGSTWLIDLDSANNCFDNVYRSTYIIQYSSTSSLLGAAANIDYNTSKVTGASTPPACGDALHISAYGTTTPNANNRSSNARASFTAFNVYGSSDVDTSPSANRLVDSYAQTSGNLVEYFDDEVYRMSADCDFDDDTLTITNVWTGSKTLVDGEAQVYSGSLIYPSVNFNAGYLPSGQSANYSAFAANQIYYRAMYDSTATPHSNGSLELGNLVNADVDPVGTGDVNVEIKLPTETGWLDLGTAYNFATFTGSDGDGCRTSQSGDDWGWTSGAFSTANSGNRYYLKITIRNSAKSLTQVRELGW